MPYYGLPAAALVLGLYRCLRERGDAALAVARRRRRARPARVIALWEVRGCAAANALAVALVPAALVRGLPAPDGRAVFLGLGRAALVAAAAASIRWR